MKNKDKQLLQEILIACNGHIPLAITPVALKSGETIKVYRKDSTCKYVCSVTKSPDAIKYKDCYTIAMDSGQELITILSPEFKAEYFKDKENQDYIGGSYGRSFGESDYRATFTKLGFSEERIEDVLNYSSQPEQINLWE